MFEIVGNDDEDDRIQEQEDGFQGQLDNVDQSDDKSGEICHYDIEFYQRCSTVLLCLPQLWQINYAIRHISVISAQAF